MHKIQYRHYFAILHPSRSQHSYRPYHLAIHAVSSLNYTAILDTAILVFITYGNIDTIVILCVIYYTHRITMMASWRTSRTATFAFSA
jgi:hypothetical protein